MAKKKIETWIEEEKIEEIEKIRGYQSRSQWIRETVLEKLEGGKNMGQVFRHNISCGNCGALISVFSVTQEDGNWEDEYLCDMCGYPDDWEPSGRR
jgi:hypothetical protein